MEIWDWVYEKEEQLRDAGENRLADIMFDLPSYCAHDEHDKVDALYAEGVAIAKKLKEPWVEVFIKHWFLQSQVLKRKNAKGMLTEAIDLLELSHRDDAKDCPQRICAVQDLANCYATADGPGFIDERIAVSKETLAEINPSWPCFICIGTEYLDALLDGSRYEDTLTECKRFKLELARFDSSDELTINSFDNSQARALIRLGRYDEALKLLKSKSISSVDGTGGKSTKILICLALAYLGKFDELSKQMFDLNDVLKSHVYYNDWAEIQAISVKADHLKFDDELAQTLRITSNNLIENGAFRNAYNQLSVLADLATQSDYLFNAGLALDKIEPVIACLNQDLGATEKFIALNAQYLERMEAYKIQAFSSMDELSSYDFSSNDEYAQHLASFCNGNSLDIKAVSLLAELYGDYLEKDKGLKLIKECHQNHPEDSGIHYSYARFLLENYGNKSFFEVFDEDLDDKDSTQNQQNLQWLYGHAYKISAPEKAIVHFKNYLEINTGHEGALYNLAWLYCELAQYAESILMWNRAIELSPDEKDYQWDKLIPATLAMDWQSVGECCEEIGIELADNLSPIEQNMGSCRIRFSDNLDSDEIHFADRTGPVSAQIKAINHIEETQRYGQTLVFNPVPLNKLDQEDEEGYKCDSEGYYNYLYEAYRLINSESYQCYEIDGVCPQQSQLESLVNELKEHGFVFDRRSSEDYQVQFSGGEDAQHEALGIYAYVLIPANADRLTLHNIFTRFSQQCEHPLIWPRLLKELELVDELEKQSAIEERYGL